MKLYVIEDLQPEDISVITGRLKAMELEAGLEDLYWLPVPPEHLTPVQKEHLPRCGPYAMALEISGDALRMELLVRARNMLRCECIAYASPALQSHMTGYLDSLLSENGIAI
ncbi:hypothetical protein Dde_2026 [Oleidesulfovibrio alaskensis G20]|jgi:hypothetical protein|uniref:Uncharacterized protein n=1 Tax=Oleidesulfovibrio alaskensis (strain ATCC BAA-1058 / DSM 17464 / G20) TaxID=207559 RepID=Q30ZS3_OLEA2|nr:hypothetical protein [Oleidesulfovibrio alaskensis]ABB38823.1 hypothetical protein Dde_2026 [Oleidesulfovibrio alaskensis G20]MBG0773124.1 hypothetical protein [Oleidesulfovibrio alaskensis]